MSAHGRHAAAVTGGVWLGASHARDMTSSSPVDADGILFEVAAVLLEHEPGARSRLGLGAALEAVDQYPLAAMTVLARHGLDRATWATVMRSCDMAPSSVFDWMPKAGPPRPRVQPRPPAGEWIPATTYSEGYFLSAEEAAARKRT